MRARGFSVKRKLIHLISLDRQEPPPIEKSESETTIANILSLCRNSGPLKVSYPNLDIVGDIVGRLVHFDLREPTFPRSYHLGPPPPVAGKHGLLSWLTLQEKMARDIIKSESYDFFTWVCIDPPTTISNTVLTNE